MSAYPWKLSEIWCCPFSRAAQVHGRMGGYGLEQELTRSEALVDVYERCLREFRNASNESEKRKLLRDVGEYAINAEANWLIIHRERPMQPVKGG